MFTRYLVEHITTKFKTEPRQVITDDNEGISSDMVYRKSSKYARSHLSEGTATLKGEYGM